MTRRTTLVAALMLFMLTCSRVFAAEPITLNLWPAKAPGETKELPPESDLTKPTDGTPGGKRVIRIGNVSTPQIAVYKPNNANGTSVIICPGGGHNILAYDHEGTEVAEFLNKFGVTGIVLKYRVPAREPDKRYRAAVQDSQRAMRIVRSKASEWNLDPKRIGILGFSAGGEVAARTALMFDQNLYEAIDDTDKLSSRPDFAALIYPAYLVERENSKLRDDIKEMITPLTPPMFLVQAFDDGVSPMNTILLMEQLKRIGVKSELHIYPTGGHGYGMRDNHQTVNTWPDRLADWLKANGWM